jgi:ribosomal-protein-alanine N-acetyltransferase
MSESRVRIAPLEAADAEQIIQANLDSRSYHHPWVSPCVNMAGFVAWMARQNETNRSFVAREASSGGVVGVVNVSQIYLGNFCSAYLGFYGIAAHAGQGLMTEALSLAIDHAFDVIGLHRLEANVQPENTRSLSLIRRLGFAREGFSRDYLRIDGAWRDHERWALLNERGD